MFFLPIRHCGSAYSKPRVLPILSSASFWCTSRRRSKKKISPRLLRSRSSPSKFVSPSTRSLVCANEIGSRGEPLRCSPQNNVYEKSLLCFHVGHAQLKLIIWSGCENKTLSSSTRFIWILFGGWVNIDNQNTKSGRHTWAHSRLRRRTQFLCLLSSFI